MDFEATCARAAALHRSGDSAGAERLYLEILAARPTHVAALSLLGVLRSQTGRKDEALELMRRAVRFDPESLPARMNYATLLQEMSRAEEALTEWDAAMIRKPDSAQIANNRANTLRALGRFSEAVAGYDRALVLEPGNAVTWFNRGFSLQSLGRLEEAAENFAKAAKLKPDFAAARYNQARLLQDLRRYEEALEAYGRVLTIEPDNFAALAGRGYLQWDRFRRYEAAVADLERAVAINPEADYVRGDLLHLKMHGADWRGHDAELARIDAGVRAGRRMVRPFAYAALSNSPADLQAAAKIYTDDAHPPLPVLWPGVFHDRKKIRLGYLCGAFSRHALAYLAAGLYEMHDRAQFEAVALDSGRSDNSEIRTRLESAFDKFISINQLSDAEAAARILAEEIDILINVDGYSGNMRMGVFARRPVPIQVNWLGFPGTLGAPYMDYIIADAIVIPPGDAPCYSEKIVTLPGSYQVNDARRAIAGQTPPRAEHGLPEKAFVFCNFNQSYKITPASFALFMRIMRQVPDSVLWLLQANPVFHENLKAEAVRQGVAADRLVFAPTLPLQEHLARMRHADIFLDSLPYNAHTTASDALWAGLPLVTCRGTAFPGRVAASLLNAAGIGELVTENAQEFETLALKLARDPAALSSVREKLACVRASAPLFDTDRYRRNIEAAYKIMWQSAKAGESPRSFVIEASS